MPKGIAKTPFKNESVGDPTTKAELFLWADSKRPRNPVVPKKLTKLEEAQAFLVKALENGRVPSLQILADARERSITPTTLRRAHKIGGYEALRIGGTGESGYWVWLKPRK